MGKNAEGQAAREQKAEVSASVAYKGKYIHVRKDIIHLDGEPPQVWDIIVPRGAVAIVAIDDKGSLLLVEQWRRAVGKIMLELPAGMLEEGEPIEASAQRELQEETGFFANDLKPFGGCYATPGISTEYFHLFLGKNLEKKPLSAEDTDVIDLRIVAVPEALTMIETGVICDAKTIVGILKYVQTL